MRFWLVRQDTKHHCISALWEYGLNGWICFQENSDNAQLIFATLQTMHKFLDWVPVGYVFENNLIDLITDRVRLLTRLA